LSFDPALWNAINQLTFGQLANVQTVGIGLYLALVVVQAVTASGVAGLRRRATAIQALANNAKVVSEASNMHKLQGEVQRLEISFQGLNRGLLGGTTLLFLFAVGYFIYCTVFQSYLALVSGVAFILGFYLVLPIAIFLGSTWLIGKRCKQVRQKIEAAEKRVSDAVLGG
jgi:uncharacterized membrane protein YbhN (UPF0104 family)